jgi:hypothetical protein
VEHPLTALTKKDNPYIWSPACQKSFEKLKKYFISASILCHFDPERTVMVETDVSNLIVMGLPSQYDEITLHPVAYFSRKHSPTEINYKIYDKELLKIIYAFKEWYPLLEGSTYTMEVILDHPNLTYFTTNQLLNYRQPHWSEFLSSFNFRIDYRPKKANSKANALI